MSTIETRASSLSEKSGIRWGRVLLAAILSELAVIVYWSPPQSYIAS